MNLAVFAVSCCYKTNHMQDNSHARQIIQEKFCKKNIVRKILQGKSYKINLVRQILSTQHAKPTSGEKVPI